jgi:hypothetical protein
MTEGPLGQHGALTQEETVGATFLGQTKAVLRPALVGAHALVAPLPPEDEPAFRAYLADAHRKIGPLFAYFVILAVVGWWPLAA